ncbi:MAG: insulinase family protein [Proteobacteria bacterium]|nr:insulinase family protein [Pseudomonadota bacterium]
MTPLFRALRLALVPLALIAAPAVARDTALPVLPPQDAPWLYRGSDVPHDKEWIFGTLPNGLRWAVRKNGVPPGQVSIRVRMDVGSMFERRGEEGYAHFLEHLVFRESKYLGQAQAIPTWQRLGATFGSDTNAETTATGTTFKIDLPGATPASLDESFKLLSGMLIQPVLSDGNVRAELPIVLAEKREHGGAPERVADATRETLFAGQPLADHGTIGTEASLTAARGDSVRAFHARWYRPENAVVVVSGDADPQLMAALVAKWFGDWRGQGPRVPAPDFGAPTLPPGADPANPVAMPRVMVEPELPRGLTMVWARAWHEKNDTIVYNQGQMLDQIAQAIINRRLEAKARRGGAFLSAQVQSESISRSIEGTFASISPTDGNWRGALAEVRGVIADAMASPPTRDDIAREVAEINVVYENQVQQRSLLPGARLADELVQAVDIHETVANPETVWAIFKRSVPLFTPQAVQEHTRRLFSGAALRVLYVTPDKTEADPAALRAALLAPVAADPAARVDNRPVSFADQPVIGPPGKLVATIPTGLLGIEQLEFANGVKVLIWPTRDDPGRVAVRVRFGRGTLGFAPAEAPYLALGRSALVPSGEGKMGVDELDRISTGRKMGFDFRIEDTSFTFSADTRKEDLADQLYLFAAKLAMPRWDAAPVERALAAAKIQAASLATAPQGVLERDLRWLQRGGDPRWATPSVEQLARLTADGFRRAWAPQLAAGPIEVQVYGDFDRAAAVEALGRSFGAIPARAAVDPMLPVLPLPEPRATPVVLRHHGDANQAAAVISWPTGGGVDGTGEGRRLEVLAQVFANRLLDALREKAGASYAPQVNADWPWDSANGGTVMAIAQLPPDMVPRFFEAADAIAADLAARPVSADELARVTEPLRQQVNRAASSTAFFMWQIEGATRYPARLTAIRSIMRDYVETSPADLQALAGRWLAPGKAWRLAVLPGK